MKEKSVDMVLTEAEANVPEPSRGIITCFSFYISLDDEQTEARL